MPTPASDKQGGGSFSELILLSFRAGKINSTRDCIPQVDLALKVVIPGGRVRILEISHEDIGAGVERVDDHLPLDRPGDLHPAVLQIVRDWRDCPIALANLFCLRKKVRETTFGDLPLSSHSLFQQLPPAILELPGEFGEKLYRISRQNLCVLPDDGTFDFNSCRRQGRIHCLSPWFLSVTWYQTLGSGPVISSPLPNCVVTAPGRSRPG